MSDLTAPPLPGPTVQQLPPYRTLIEEAYISPIRTVIAVDDEFPSLDAMLGRFVNDGALWEGNRDMAVTALEILQYCRRRQTPWLVDVHDGTISDLQTIAIPQLHQSDLVILDYHLDGGDDGQKALALLRSLAKKDHFNMVVVYTKGNQAGIAGVFWEIVTSVTHSSWNQQPKPERLKQVNDAVARWGDSDENISERLNALVSRETYLKERAEPCSSRAAVFPSLQAIVREAPEGVTIQPAPLFEWLLNQEHIRNTPHLAIEDLGPLAFCFDGDDANWIRTDRLFITVVNKKTRPAEIESALLEALVKCGPSPLQLLMAKMRAHMDEKGAGAEAELLKDEYLKAGWLSELFAGEHTDRKRLLRTTVDRHWDALGQKLRSELDNYAGRLIDHVEARGREQVIAEYVSKSVLAQPEKILAHLNSYNCAKPPDRSHLTTGHILEMRDAATAESVYWVCLSPACDLVPGQKQSSSSWYGRLKGFMPFTAVRLEPANKGTAIEKANLNSFVFFFADGEVKAFTFYPSSDPTASPAWEQMFAAHEGRFIGDTETAEIRRISAADGSLTLSDPANVTVVAQLRYEYALNLLQRLGTTLSRVGLDFKAQAKPEPLRATKTKTDVPSR